MSMRKTLFSIATALLCFTGCTSVPKTCEQPYEPIQIAVPERPAGQQDAVGLTAPKIDTVRVGFIGVGHAWHQCRGALDPHPGCTNQSVVRFAS